MGDFVHAEPGVDATGQLILVQPWLVVFPDSIVPNAGESLRSATCHLDILWGTEGVNHKSYQRKKKKKRKHTEFREALKVLATRQL